jgi:hypothetical protein
VVGGYTFIGSYTNQTLTSGGQTEMESLITILNFEDYPNHEINSPRTLEACLRCGYEPNELLPKNKKFFSSRDLTDEMVTLKYQTFERKRKGFYSHFFLIRTDHIPFPSSYLSWQIKFRL